MNLCDCMFIVAINDVNCDESGAIVASSCDMCPYEMFIDHYGNDFAHYYDNAYDYIFNDGTFCKGDCSWNSDLEECQMKGTFLITIVYIQIEEESHIGPALKFRGVTSLRFSPVPPSLSMH